MDHVAIDLGKRESQVCVRDGTGQIVEEKRVRTRELGKVLGGRPRSRVIVETSAEAFGVADLAKEHGHEVRVVPSAIVRLLGVGARKLKTDQRDARALSEASCLRDLPSVHVPSALSRRLKEQCTAREALIGCRTKLTNTIKGLVRSELGSVAARGGSPRFVSKVRAQVPSQPQLEWLVAPIEALNAQIHQADRELLAIAKEHPVTRLLMSMPGVGPVTAIRFVSALDDATRFSSASEVASYLGLVPGENTTGFKPVRLGITKAGPSKVRWALSQAAWCLWRTRPNDPLVKWAKRIAERRGRQKAIGALSRKMATILWAMWRDGKRYDPPRAVSGSSD